MAELLSGSLQTAVATQTEYTLPSIFEVLAQENLRSSVRPAFEYLTKVLANYQPQRFGWILAWFDEIFTIVELFVQHHFLLSHIASYAEMYYGLRRKIKGLKVQSHRHLGKKLHLLSLVTLCIMPYIGVKLRRLYKRVKEQHENTGSLNGLTLPSMVIFWTYPTVCTVWELLRLHHQFKYAIHDNKYYDPFLRLLKIKLVIEDPALASATSGNVVSRVLTRMISGGVHAGVFVLQFLEWWYSDENQTSVQKITQAPVPEAPSDNCSLPQTCKKSICPICNRKRVNDTALSTSGYVFCYICIYKYIQVHTRCPVTGFPTKIVHLIKLYPPE